MCRSESGRFQTDLPFRKERRASLNVAWATPSGERRPSFSELEWKKEFSHLFREEMLHEGRRSGPGGGGWDGERGPRWKKLTAPRRGPCELQFGVERRWEKLNIFELKFWVVRVCAMCRPKGESFHTALPCPALPLFQISRRGEVSTRPYIPFSVCFVSTGFADGPLLVGKKGNDEDKPKEK